MLSIVKINAADHQGKAGEGYVHYLGEPSTRQRGDFDDYARGKDGPSGPAPFWACNGPALLGLDDIAQAEQVERLAHGLHPMTGEPLVKGAGSSHVMGLDMTFSAPKDANSALRNALLSVRIRRFSTLSFSASSAIRLASASFTLFSSSSLASLSSSDSPFAFLPLVFGAISATAWEKSS